MDDVSPIEKQDVLGNTIQPECLQTVINGQPMHNLNRGAKGVCLFCNVLSTAYQRGYDDAEKLHEDCECYRIGICQIHGEVKWVMYDDLKFVPDSVVLDAYHRGRNDAARAIVAEIDAHKPDAMPNNYQEGLLDGLDIALGAARGGEQE